MYVCITSMYVQMYVHSNAYPGIMGDIPLLAEGEKTAKNGSPTRTTTDCRVNQRTKSNIPSSSVHSLLKDYT